MSAIMEKTEVQAIPARIDVVDHADRAWNGVLTLVMRTGDWRKLQMDHDGWLSARQIVLAAFVDGKPVAHLSFHIEPGGRSSVDARLDTYGIDAEFADRGIEHRLWVAAVARARDLRCMRLIGFEIASPWL